MGTATVQGDLWSGNPRDWAEFQEPLFAPMYRAVLDRAGVGAGARVLDVGCGSGLFCSFAAQRGAAVAGIDAAEGLLAIARASATRCCWPPESWPGRRFRRASNASEVATSFALARRSCLPTFWIFSGYATLSSTVMCGNSA